MTEAGSNFLHGRADSGPHMAAIVGLYGFEDTAVLSTHNEFTSDNSKRVDLFKRVAGSPNTAGIVVLQCLDVLGQSMPVMIKGDLFGNARGNQKERGGL